MTMHTTTANFEGFSQTLKEQSGKIKYYDVFTYPNIHYSNLKYENEGLPKTNIL